MPTAGPADRRAWTYGALSHVALSSGVAIGRPRSGPALIQPDDHLRRAYAAMAAAAARESRRTPWRAGIDLLAGRGMMPQSANGSRRPANANGAGPSTGPV